MSFEAQQSLFIEGTNFMDHTAIGLKIMQFISMVYVTNALYGVKIQILHTFHVIPIKILHKHFLP